RCILPNRKPVPMSYAEKPADRSGLRRGTFLKLGAAGAGAFALGAAGEAVIPELKKRGLFSANGVFDAASTSIADVGYLEVFPPSPLILSPFRDPLLVPKAMRPIPSSIYSTWATRDEGRLAPPGFGLGMQNSLQNETHQIPSAYGAYGPRTGDVDFPIVYKI